MKSVFTILALLISLNILGQSLGVSYQEKGKEVKTKLIYAGKTAALKTYTNNKVPNRIKVGKPMIDFVAQDANGNSYRTKDYRGKYLVLEFAATWCGPCWGAYPTLSLIKDRFDEIEILSFNVDSDIEKWAQIAKKDSLNVNWTVLWNSNEKREIFKKYKIKGYPQSFLISPEGIVIDSWLGAGNLISILWRNKVLEVENP